jgi:polyhydroxybutyrate depolymerase
MKTILKLLRFGLYLILAVVVVGGMLFGYFVYTPDPGVPTLSGTLTKDSIEVGGLTRTYLSYVPHGLPKSAALVLVLHGSGESGVQIRRETGYGFDRLADRDHFAVVYPDAHRSAQGDWNACGTVGDVNATKASVDDVTFLTRLVENRVADLGADPHRVFAVGSSRGGFMAFRLALEAPPFFRAVAAVSANVHTAENFKCRPSHDGTSSVLIMNGTKDPIVPFDGGTVSLLGFSYKYGRVMSSEDSARFFANLNHLGGAPVTVETQLADGVSVNQTTWKNASNVEVELVAIEGGGHGMPQPYRRHPRLLGPSLNEPNGPELIWAFFERQRR